MSFVLGNYKQAAISQDSRYLALLSGERDGSKTIRTAGVCLYATQGIGGYQRTAQP